MLLTMPKVKGLWLKEGYNRTAIFKTSFNFLKKECKSKTRIKAQEKILFKLIWISIQFQLTLRFFPPLLINFCPLACCEKNNEAATSVPKLCKWLFLSYYPSASIQSMKNLLSTSPTRNLVQNIALDVL